MDSAREPEVNTLLLSVEQGAIHVNSIHVKVVSPDVVLLCANTRAKRAAVYNAYADKDLDHGGITGAVVLASDELTLKAERTADDTRILIKNPFGADRMFDVFALRGKWTVTIVLVPTVEGEHVDHPADWSDAPETPERNEP